MLIGGSIFALLAGLHYWFPLMFGRKVSEFWGKLSFWIIFVGFNATFFPMHFLGLNGMPRRVYTYSEGLGFDFWNMFQTVGSFLLGFSFLILIVNIIRSRRSAPAPADPWHGATLEWSIPSPPQEFNFPKLPQVGSSVPQWDAVRAAGGKLPEPALVSGAGIVMPNPSYWPAMAAIGVFLVLASLMFIRSMPGKWFFITLFGLAWLFVSVYKWAFEKPH